MLLPVPQQVKNSDGKELYRPHDSTNEKHVSMLQNEIASKKEDAPQMDITREYTEKELRKALRNVNKNPKETLQFLTQYMFAQHRVKSINDPDCTKT